VTEYYHRYVFAQSTVLSSTRCWTWNRSFPGREKPRLRALAGPDSPVYGARFFDAVTIDSWYVQGPFLKAVEKLGWEWVVVLKQERMEVLQEARALSAAQETRSGVSRPTRGPAVKLWEVKDLDFSESYGRKVRVVHAAEQWVEKKMVGGKKISRTRPATGGG